MNASQHTIQYDTSCRGQGLHSGASIHMTIRPAPPDSGIRFKRLDIGGSPVIAARHEQVVDTRLATTIGSGGVVVSTIEHLMAAFMGAGVDNALVELDGPEVPIFDGSAAPHLRQLRKAGLRAQGAPRAPLRIRKPLTVREGDAYIKAEPSDVLRVRYIIDFPHPLVGRQELSWTFGEDAFSRDIAGARTFGFLKDVNLLKSMGLAKGGSLENAVVFDDQSLLNQEGFRYADECVRHKILDFLGDISLYGRPVIGSFEAYKAGHALHGRFLEALTKETAKRSVTAFAPNATPSYVPEAFSACYGLRPSTAA